MAQIKTMETKYADDNCILHQYSCAGGRKSVSFKKVLGEVVKILISLNLNP